MGSTSIKQCLKSAFNQVGPSRGILHDYEPSCGPSFQALIGIHKSSPRCHRHRSARHQHPAQQFPDFLRSVSYSQFASIKYFQASNLNCTLSFKLWRAWSGQTQTCVRCQQVDLGSFSIAGYQTRGKNHQTFARNIFVHCSYLHKLCRAIHKYFLRKYVSTKLLVFRRYLDITNYQPNGHHQK